LLKYTIKGIIVSNTTNGNRENLINMSKHQKGGLSGKPLETRSNQLINIFYNLLKGKISIIGVGGVDSGKSAYAKFLAGANFIQLYTGMVYQGPNIVLKIKNELKELLINKGVRNFQDIIGKK
jgi:dihydroorotate dehydrogenase